MTEIKRPAFRVMVGFVCLLAIAIGWLAVTKGAALARNADLQTQLQRLTADNDALRAERNRLADQVNTLSAQLHVPVTPPLILMSEFDLDRLKDRGLASPVDEIAASLIARRDLIPFSGVLGGTMAFRYPGEWVITEKWVLALFEDGHISGRAFLEYSVTDGKIEWQLIRAYLDK